VVLAIGLPWLFNNGLRQPPHHQVNRAVVVLLAVILISFPASVLAIRLGVRRANRMKAD